MDRFIVEDLQSLRKTIVRLKSNMDRFIECIWSRRNSENNV